MESPDVNPQALDDAVVIALGGNLPGQYDSVQALLEAALARFPEAGLRTLARSDWWSSSAWPDPADPPFVNAVVLARTGPDPAATLRAMHELESAFGRRRDSPNAPRTLDLDLIAHGRAVIDAPGLVVPHPRAFDRAFVMGPLAQIAPGWRHPVSGRTATQMAANATVGRDARPLS